jgi:hypothetical protein
MYIEGFEEKRPYRLEIKIKTVVTDIGWGVALR